VSASTPTPRPTPTAAAASTPPIPRTGKLVDRGVVRRDSVRAEVWDLVGRAKVLGDADVGRVATEGTVVVGGGVSADTVSARGTLDVAGPVEVRSSLECDGTFRGGAAVHASDADLHGTSRILGEIRVDRVLRVRGSFSAPSVKAGELTLRGEAHVPGRVTAERVSAVLDGDSAFGTVEALSVHLEGRTSSPVQRLLGHRTTVVVDRVEADTVELEAVEVGFVRGTAISLGRDCHVGAVEGKVVRCHPTSHVGPESRTPPPPGLSR